MPDVLDEVTETVQHTEDTNVLDLVVDLSDKTAGVLLKWWDTGSERINTALGAHWLTIIVLDC